MSLELWAVILVPIGLVSIGALVSWMFAVNAKLAVVVAKLEDLTTKPQVMCVDHARRIEDLERRMGDIE